MLQDWKQHTQIHRYATELEGEFTPAVAVITPGKIVKQLLKDLAQRQRRADAEKNDIKLLVGYMSQLPCNKGAKRETYDGEQNVERAIGRGRGHRYGGGFKELVQCLIQFLSASFVCGVILILTHKLTYFNKKKKRPIYLTQEINGVYSCWQNA